jgi:hypothetical protein
MALAPSPRACAPQPISATTQVPPEPGRDPAAPGRVPLNDDVLGGGGLPRDHAIWQRPGQCPDDQVDHQGDAGVIELARRRLLGVEHQARRRDDMQAAEGARGDRRVRVDQEPVGQPGAGHGLREAAVHCARRAQAGAGEVHGELIPGHGDGRCHRHRVAARSRGV